MCVDKQIFIAKTCELVCEKSSFFLWLDFEGLTLGAASLKLQGMTGGEKKRKKQQKKQLSINHCFGKELGAKIFDMPEP